MIARLCTLSHSCLARGCEAYRWLCRLLYFWSSNLWFHRSSLRICDSTTQITAPSWGHHCGFTPALANYIDETQQLADEICRPGAQLVFFCKTVEEQLQMRFAICIRHSCKLHTPYALHSLPLDCILYQTQHHCDLRTLPSSAIGDLMLQMAAIPHCCYHLHKQQIDEQTLCILLSYLLQCIHAMAWQ